MMLQGRPIEVAVFAAIFGFLIGASQLQSFIIS